MARATSRGPIRGADDVRGIFTSIDPSGSGAMISYCRTGPGRATAWFALTYLLGRRRIRVCDGSCAEWWRIPRALAEPT
jgi:thiosulfate/3-mercaptopyruvate sulfurtransferase